MSQNERACSRHHVNRRALTVIDEGEDTNMKLVDQQPTRNVAPSKTPRDTTFTRLLLCKL